MTVPRRGKSLPAFGVALLLIMALGAPQQTWRALDFVQTSTPSGSWGLGLVVPQGATLSGAGEVSWPNTENLSALVRLPSLSATDNTILLVLSAMTASGSVLQVAAGLFPQTSTWRAVGWFIPDVGAVPQQYEWVLNSSAPAMPPGSSVTLSIFRSAGAWRYGVADLDSGSQVSGPFTSAAGVPFKAGDQEAFALESYTYNATVLTEMGNVTLTSLLLDGRAVIGGFYYLSDWAPSHSPLFVVGGLSAPASVSVQNLQNGTLVWSYSTSWRVVDLPAPWIFYTAALAAAVAVPVLLFLVAVRARRPRVRPASS